MAQRINLFQEQFRRRSDVAGARHLALGVLAVVVVLAAATAAMTWRARAAEAEAAELDQRRAEVRQGLDALRERLEKARATRTADAETARLRAELAAKRRLVDYLERGPIATREGFVGHLEGLASHEVGELWLTRIRIDAGGNRLRLEGRALSAARVPAFIRALSDARAFSGHSFRTLRIDRPDDADGRLRFVLASGAGGMANGSGGDR